MNRLVRSSRLTNNRQIMIGIFLLLIGALVYVVDRPPEQTYFLSKIPFKISLYHISSSVFGPVGNVLPDFLHVVGFIFLTAGILNCGRLGYYLICLFWLIIDAAFELGQKYTNISTALVPDWFEGVCFFENTKNFFMSGTYSHIDLGAIIVGAIVAFPILVYTQNR